MKNNETENFKKYQEYMERNGYNKLPLPKTIPTISQLAAEGEKILADEEKKDSKTTPVPTTPVPPKPSKALENALGAMSKNPYVKARIDVLKKMSEFARHEIETMEKERNVNNRFYAQFTAEVVTAAGDMPSLQLRNYLKGV